MKIRCFLTAVIVGLMLMSMPRAAANEVLFHVELAELSPALRDLVAKEFPKDPLLREYLDHDSDDDECRDPMEKFSGATVPLNTKGDLGAFIYVLGCGWGGTA